MTAIAAVAEKGKVWIGGDSAGVRDTSLRVRRDEKVFVNQKFLFGCTSSFRMGQLLRYSFIPPEHSSEQNDVTYMATKFVDAVRDCLKTGGYAKIESNKESGGTFLVGYRGKIYSIHEDFQVGRPLDGYAAVGCGDDLCLGALYATRGQLPMNRIKIALRAAERFSSGVRGPFVIRSL